VVGAAIEKSASAVGRLLTEASLITLDRPIRDDKSGTDLVEAAIPEFAAAFNVAIPSQIVLDLPDRWSPILVLHTAALVAVLRGSMAAVGNRGECP
jgi:hypothetical protein